MKKNLFNFKITVILLGVFFATSASAYTAVVSGNWSNPVTWGGVAPTANVSNQDIIIPLGITVTLDQDVTFSGLLNSFTVDGNLSGTTTDGVTISMGTLAGAGTISIDHLAFTGVLSSASFTGDINVKEFTNTTPVLGITAVVMVEDTLDLDSGNLLLNTNSNLTMATNSTIKVNDGSITVNGGIFNLTNAYNVMYIGTTKTAGIELNAVTLQHLYLNMISNIEAVSLNGNTTVNDTLNISSGKLSLNGSELTLIGDLMMATGTRIISTATSSLTIEGTGVLNDTLMFDLGAIIQDLTINRTTIGVVKLGSGLNISGYLHLMDGTLSIDSASTLTMNAASVIHREKGEVVLNNGMFNGNATYNVEYMGIIGQGAIAGVELSGNGLNDVTINYPDTNTVTLSDTTTINGNLNLVNGTLHLVGKAMILNGTLTQTYSGRISGNSNSDLELNLTSVTNDTLYFDQGTGFNSLNKLKINTAGSNTLILGAPIFIHTELNMVSGKFELVDEHLSIMPSASIVGYNENRYIITSAPHTGKLVMNVITGSTYVTFPVGTSSGYAPVQVQQVIGATGNFSVNVMDSVLSNAYSGFSYSDSAKMVDKTWFINSPTPTTNTNIKLGWLATSEVNGFTRSNSYITNYGDSGWDTIPPTAATAGANNTFEQTRMGITSLSPPLAVMEENQAIQIKEIATTTDFYVYPNPSKDVVNIKSSNLSDDYKYELVDITGRTLRSIQGKNSNKFDVVNLEAGCYFIKAINLTTNKIVTKRFIKE